MEEEMKENVEVKQKEVKQERNSEKIRQKKNNFTMAYILVGICIIAILVILLAKYLMG